MLLMPIVTAAVPDTPDAPGATGLLPDEAGKAELDAGQLDVDALGPPVEDKVELDLEDAPFLLPEEEKAPPRRPPPPSPLRCRPMATPPRRNSASTFPGCWPTRSC